MRKVDQGGGFGQLKYTKTADGIVVKVRYEAIPKVLSSVPKLAPLLEDRLPDEPDLDELKNVPEMHAFLREWKGEITFTVFVRSEGDSNVEKVVCLVDDKNRACAVSTWTRDGGMSFDIVQ